MNEGDKPCSWASWSDWTMRPFPFASTSSSFRYWDNFLRYRESTTSYIIVAVTNHGHMQSSLEESLEYQQKHAALYQKLQFCHFHPHDLSVSCYRVGYIIRKRHASCTRPARPRPTCGNAPCKYTAYGELWLHCKSTRDMRLIPLSLFLVFIVSKMVCATLTISLGRQRDFWRAFSVIIMIVTLLIISFMMVQTKTDYNFDHLY